MRCDTCGQEVPDGLFCTRCGAQQGMLSAGGKMRRGRYAASPNEPVAQPAVMTALFPHLGQDEVNEFRWAFLAGAAVIVVLYLAGFITAALLAAAFLVPILYVMYLYEVRVYRDTPLPVLGFTIGGGIVVGVLLTLLTSRLVSPFPAVQTTALGPVINVGALLLVGLLIPIVQEIVKPLPALLLRGRTEFAQTIDGLVFGVAAGLGFALAETIIEFSRVLTGLDVRVDPANWLFPLISIGVLLPLLHGSSTGAVTASIWRFRRNRWGRIEAAGIPVAIAAHVAFVIGTLLLTAWGFGPLIWLGWQAIVVGALLIYVRLLLHDALIDEAAEMGMAQTQCPNCHRNVVAAGFCPNCGMSLMAVPDSVRRAREDLPARSDEVA